MTKNQTIKKLNNKIDELIIKGKIKEAYRLMRLHRALVINLLKV